MDNKLTEEQVKDVDARINAFMKDYEELTKKHEVDFVSYPVWLPTATGAFETRMQTSPVDRKYVPVKSPFIKEAK